MITVAVVEEVARLMAKGMPEKYACALVGVSAETFGPAVSRNAELKAVHTRILAEFIRDSLDIIVKGGEVIRMATGEMVDGEPVVQEKVMPWTGRAWILERRHKPDFTKTIVEAKGDKDAPSSGALLSEADMLLMEKVMKEKIMRGEEG